jgi:hypothetical protein
MQEEVPASSLLFFQAPNPGTADWRLVHNTSPLSLQQFRNHFDQKT